MANNAKRVTNQRLFIACWKRNVLIRRVKNNRDPTARLRRFAQDDKSEWCGPLIPPRPDRKKRGRPGEYDRPRKRWIFPRGIPACDHLPATYTKTGPDCRISRETGEMRKPEFKAGEVGRLSEWPVCSRSPSRGRLECGGDSGLQRRGHASWSTCSMAKERGCAPVKRAPVSIA